jgi:TonB family protein
MRKHFIILLLVLFTKFCASQACLTIPQLQSLQKTAFEDFTMELSKLGWQVNGMEKNVKRSYEELSGVFDVVDFSRPESSIDHIKVFLLREKMVMFEMWCEKVCYTELIDACNIRYESVITEENYGLLTQFHGVNDIIELKQMGVGDDSVFSLFWVALSELEDASESSTKEETLREEPDSEVDPTALEPFQVVSDDEPEYPGGLSAMISDVVKNIHGQETWEDDEQGGRIIVSFVVEKDGAVSNVKVERGIGSPQIEMEVMRAVKALKPFSPAKTNGNAVRFRMLLPVNIVTN